MASAGALWYRVCMQVLEEIQARLVKARKRLEKVDNMRSSIAMEINDLEAAVRVLENIGQPDGEAGKPTVSDRIVAALESLGQPTSKADLKSYLDLNGEQINPNTLTGTLQRLSEGLQVFHKDGKWFLGKWRAGAQ